MSVSNRVEAIEVLMVDDDELDIELFQRSMQRERIANNIVTARNGIEALEIMRGQSETKIHSPYIVLLDINMPRMTGIECLREIRADPALRSTVVFILTTSENDQDVLAAYDLNVAGYMVKSDLGTSFVEGVKLLENYWRIIEMPQEVDSAPS